VSTATTAPSRRSPRPPVPPPARRGGGRGRRWAGIALRYALLLLVLVITVGPFLWQLSTSLKGAGENLFANPPDLIPNNPTLENYAAVAQVVPLASYVRNSLVVAVASTITNCLFGAMAGYALARMRFRFRGAVLAVIVATLVIPFEVILISVFLITRSLGLVNTLPGVVLPTAVTALSIFIMRSGFLDLPREVEEAGRVDGAGEWQLFRHVALPSVRGQLAVVGIFSFTFAWDDFLWPLIVLRDPANYTLTVGIQFLSGTFSRDQAVIAAGTMIAVAPLILLFILLQKQFFRGVGEGAVKG